MQKISRFSRKLLHIFIIFVLGESTMKKIILQLIFLMIVSLGSVVYANKKEHSDGKVVVYRPNKEYVGLLPVGMSADKGKIISVPLAESLDSVTLNIRLANGFYIDVTGNITPLTMYTDIRLEDYIANPKNYTKQRINESLIPDSYIEIYAELPLTINEALSDTVIVNKIISEGFKGCKIIKGKPMLIGDPYIIGTNY